MAEQTFNQKIDGTRREVAKSGIPKISGVYFVYEGHFDENQGTIYPKKLIYIGESEDIKDRLNKKHEHYDDWLNYVREGNTLCYSYTEVEPTIRERVEAAYIYSHQPPVNIDCKASFNYDKTTVKSSPKWDSIGNSYIQSEFTCERS